MTRLYSFTSAVLHNWSKHFRSCQRNQVLGGQSELLPTWNINLKKKQNKNGYQIKWIETEQDRRERERENRFTTELASINTVWIRVVHDTCRTTMAPTPSNARSNTFIKKWKRRDNAAANSTTEPFKSAYWICQTRLKFVTGRAEPMVAGHDNALLYSLL